MAVTAGFNILEGCGQMLCLANILKNYRMAKSFLRFFVPDNNFIEKTRDFNKCWKQRGRKCAINMTESLHSFGMFFYRYPSGFVAAWFSCGGSDVFLE